MSNINFNVEQLVCDKPVITDAHGVFGKENYYSVSWTSNGDYLNLVDPIVTVELWFSIDGGPFQSYSGNAVPYNYTDLEINFNSIGIPANGVTFVIKMITPFCEEVESDVVFAPSIV